MRVWVDFPVVIFSLLEMANKVKYNADASPYFIHSAIKTTTVVMAIVTVRSVLVPHAR